MIDGIDIPQAVERVVALSFIGIGTVAYTQYSPDAISFIGNTWWPVICLSWIISGVIVFLQTLSQWPITTHSKGDPQ